MTLEQFEEQYIIKHNKEEKGIFITDKNGFKNDKKIIRYLSQISYRLLNYILYVHLFFARAVSDKNNFDKYIPKNMGEFVDTINECWKILKNELLKLNIDSIEEFMHYVFIYLFPILNKEKAIDTYEKLISFENILEKKIQELIIRFKDGSNKLEPMKETDINKDVATINLLKEKYASSYYNESEYPFYDYFYYTDYLNENYIYEKLNQNDPNTYPILKLYLDSILLKDEKKKYSLNKLNLFNSTLNLINEKYTNKISREIAKKRLKDDEVYINNKELFDNFIKFYNKLEFKIQLTTENKLCDFFIDEDNEYGKTYLNIYKEFIKEQNEKLQEFLDKKIESGIFDETCKNKINIQQINEKEIFNLELPEDISFIDILFNSSYRKILDSEPFGYKAYREYQIDFDFIEEKMTDLLLKNKKLLNENITAFIYNNEVFNHPLNDLITLFKKRYDCKNIIINDQLPIYKFYKNNQYINSYKTTINDFITLIKFLNNLRRDNNIDNDNKFDEKSKIYEIIDQNQDDFSENFIKIFKDNEGLTVNKVTDIFEYYLKLIYDDSLKEEFNDYQEKLDITAENSINEYYKNNHAISKKDLAHAIRLFILLVLLPEEDKKNKIKNNHNNVINYLKSSDLWQLNVYNNNDFKHNLNELKLINAQISQILDLYKVLGTDIEENFTKDIEERSKEEEIIEKQKQPNPFNNAKDENEEDDDDVFKKKKNSDDDDDDE